MANHEQESASTDQGDDWLSEAMDAEVPASSSVESVPQDVSGDVEATADVSDVETTSNDSGGGSGRERDERGRFKAKQGTQEQTAEAEPQTQEDTAKAAVEDEPEPQQETSDDEDDSRGKIPSWRVREIREARDAERARAEKAEENARAAAAQTAQLQQYLVAMQQQIQQLQNPQKTPEPVNLFEDPDAFVGSWEQKLVAQEQSFQKQIRQIRLENNLSIAAMTHKDDFQPAYEAFTDAVERGDRALAARVFGSTDPGGSMVAWYREQRTLKEIGTDPNAYVQSKLEEALNDPAFLAKALEAAKAKAIGQPAAASAAKGQTTTRPNTIVKRPPSLSGVPGGASAHAASSTGGDWLSEALGDR